MLHWPVWVCQLPVRSSCDWACHLAPLTLWRYDLDLGNLVTTAVSNTLMLHWPVWVCQPPMRCRCAWTYHLAPATFDLRVMTLTLRVLYNSVGLEVTDTGIFRLPSWISRSMRPRRSLVVSALSRSYTLSGAPTLTLSSFTYLEIFAGLYTTHFMYNMI